MKVTWLWVSGAALAVTLGGGLLAAKPLARRVIERKALARGVELEVDDLRLGLFEADLGGVRAHLIGVPAIEVKLDRVSVDVSWRGSPERVLVQGGHVDIRGSVDEVRQQLADWQSRRPATAEASSSGGGQRTALLRDLEVQWQGAFADDDRQVIHGLQIERTSEGLRVGADLVDVGRGPLRVEVAGASLRSSREAMSQGRIQELGASEMRLSWTAPEQKASADPDASGEDAEETEVHNDALGSLMHPHPERTAQIRVALALLRKQILPRLPDRASVERLWLSYVDGAEQLKVGPNELSAKNDAQTFVARLTPRGRASGTPLSLTLRLPRHELAADEAAASVEIAGGPVAFSTLGLADGPFGLRSVDHTFVEGSGQARLSADASFASAAGTLIIDGLSIDSRALSESIVVFPRMVIKGKGMFSTAGTKIEAEDLEFSLGEARFLAGLSLEREDEALRVKGHASAPLVSCQALLDSAPRGLLGPVEHIKFAGTFSLRSSVDLDTTQLSKMAVHFDFQNGCKALAVPRVLDPDQFREIFRRQVQGAGNFPMEVEFGPHSPGWVDIEEVSPFVEAGLLVSEDGRFFRHDGFDDRAIESAITDNAKAGRFVRGASTISMQLAKNLYLSRDKTLSRKFQEAALTSLLEQSFSKQELLELYVNVVEFGPGIYGIRQAAEYYFNTVPRDLSAAQSFFFTSILPNPKREFFGPDGHIKPSTLKYVHRLLTISHQRGRLSDEELEAALSEELVFGRATTFSPEKAAAEAPADLPDQDLKSPATISRDERERAPVVQPSRRGIEL